MLRQRIYQIMAGFEDADDCDRLCRDGILKMCAGRSASDEIDLASQPTMTRLENRLSRRELFDIGEAFIDDFIASYESEPDSIIIDADDTNADTYGAQQLTLFNAYYGQGPRGLIRNRRSEHGSRCLQETKLFVYLHPQMRV